MSSLLNEPASATVFSREMDRLLKKAGYDPGVKTEPTRPATIFVGNAIAGMGDTLPYLRVVKELSAHLNANYHILLNCVTDLERVASVVKEALCANELKTSRRTSTKVYTDQDKWIQALEVASVVDIVVFNQDVNWLNEDHKGHERRTWVRMYEAIKKKDAVFVHLEFLWQGPGTSAYDEKWWKRLESQEATVQEYLQSFANPTINKAEVKRGRRNTLPRLFLECYPAWILTEEERKRTTGILCGKVDPLLSDEAGILDDTLAEFITEQKHKDKKLVLIARGGNSSPLWKNDAEERNGAVAPKLAVSLLQIPDVAVLVLDKPNSGHQLLQAGIFTFPYLRVRLDKLLAIVDLVVHHGGAGTTFSAMEKGTPQIIIPNSGDTPDQLFHGGKVSTLGCGTLLRPRSRRGLSNDHDDVVEAARSLLDNIDHFKPNCAKAKEKTTQDDEVLQYLAVEGLKRIADAVVGMKQAGRWKGWTPDVCEKDLGRSGEEAAVLKDHGYKRK